MFNPAFIFVFQEIENEVLNNEMLIKNFLDFMCIVSVSIMACGIYGIIMSLQIPAHLNTIWSLFWNTLTPGNQWLEIAYVLSSFLVFISMLFFVDAVINDMIETTNQRIKTMNKSLEEKEKLIAELEAIIKEQEQQKKELINSND
jgi:hypothetical protein